MAAPTGDFYGVGARYARALVLNSAGIPAASAASGAVYEGFELATLKNFNVETPDARIIDHYGGDRVRAKTILPPNQSGQATMALGSINPATFAALTGTKVATIGEATVIGHGSNKRGYEPDVCLWAAQLQTTSGGLERWKMDIAPVAKAMFKNASMNDNPAEYAVNLALMIAQKFPWGIAFTEATQGYTSAEAVSIYTEHFPMLVAFLGDNVVTEFNFATGHEAYATTKIHGVWVWDAGTGVAAVDASAALATDGVTPTTKPDVGDLVVVLYELANAPE
jgi:hypothetical protein